jgi:hypothetical protein
LITGKPTLGRSYPAAFRLRPLTVALASATLSAMTACSFQTPNFDQPLGCACDVPDHAYVYCDFARCRLACALGFLDWNQNPYDGCEVDRAGTPGNFKASNLTGSSTWLLGVSGYLPISASNVAMTIADPACEGSKLDPCEFRVEAMQLEFSTASLRFEESSFGPSDAIIETIVPVPVIDIGFGASIDAAYLAAGTRMGDTFTPLTDLSGGISLIRGSVTGQPLSISLSGSVVGNFGNNGGLLVEFNASTPRPPFMPSRRDGGADAAPDTGAESDAPNTTWVAADAEAGTAAPDADGEPDDDAEPALDAGADGSAD